MIDCLVETRNHILELESGGVVVSRSLNRHVYDLKSSVSHLDRHVKNMATVGITQNKRPAPSTVECDVLPSIRTATAKTTPGADGPNHRKRPIALLKPPQHPASSRGGSPAVTVKQESVGFLGSSSQKKNPGLKKPLSHQSLAVHRPPVSMGPPPIPRKTFSPSTDESSNGSARLSAQHTQTLASTSPSRGNRNGKQAKKPRCV